MTRLNETESRDIKGGGGGGGGTELKKIGIELGWQGTSDRAPYAWYLNANYNYPLHDDWPKPLVLFELVKVESLSYLTQDGVVNCFHIYNTDNICIFSEGHSSLIPPGVVKMNDSPPSVVISWNPNNNMNGEPSPMAASSMSTENRNLTQHASLIGWKSVFVYRTQMSVQQRCLLLFVGYAIFFFTLLYVKSVTFG